MEKGCQTSSKKKGKKRRDKEKKNRPGVIPLLVRLEIAVKRLRTYIFNGHESGTITEMEKYEEAVRVCQHALESVGCEAVENVFNGT